jgi:hypothetical protein
MVGVKLYVEGGGNAKPLKTACRNGFSEFLKKKRNCRAQCLELSPAAVGKWLEITAKVSLFKMI